MILVYTLNIISTLLPLILLHLIFLYFYQTNIFSIASWWFKNHAKTGYFGLAMMGLFFASLLVWVSFSSIIRDVTIAFNSETHEMIYVGEVEKNTSHLYHANNTQLAPIASLNTFDNNLSFAPIYRTVTFKSDSRTQRLGVKNKFNSFSLISFLQTVLLIIGYAPLFLIVAHAFALGPQIDEVDSELTWGESFWQVYKPYGLNLKNLLVGSSLFIFGPIILIAFLPSNNQFGSPPVLKDRAIGLPSFIHPGKRLFVEPVSSYKVTVEGIENNNDIETNARVVIFKFEEGFSIPVYVSYHFSAEKHPTLFSTVNRLIESKRLMAVKIQADLSLKVDFRHLAEIKVKGPVE